jgi:hypothetical protein
VYVVGVGVDAAIVFWCVGVVVFCVQTGVGGEDKAFKAMSRVV